jgi:hypothetical protein
MKRGAAGTNKSQLMIFHAAGMALEEQEGFHGVCKRLRRNRHLLRKGSWFEQVSTKDAWH